MTAECIFILVPLILPHQYGFSNYSVCLFLCVVALSGKKDLF